MIEQITIKNYKSIREIERLPLRRINVLIGENGAGKSNFISFFEMLNAIYERRFGQYVLQRGGIGRFFNFHAQTDESIFCMVDFNNLNAVSLNIIPSQTGKGIISNFSHFFNGCGDKGKNYRDWHNVLLDSNVEESDIQLDNSKRVSYVKKQLAGFKVYHFHDTSLKSPMRGPSIIGDYEMLRSDASNLAAWLYRMKHTDKLNFQLIEEIVKSVAPYFRKFHLEPDAINPHQIKLEWEEENSDRYLDGYSFSDGTIRFVALASLLLSEQRPDVILIDEPELGLHPAAMTKLAAMIRRASQKSQIIVSTQSAAFVDEFDAEDIIVAERSEEESVFHRLDPEKLKSWRNHYSLGELWRKNVLGGRP
ncbi:MAG: AAA family ATPase [Bacteroidaceae bacterium]|nr:AAA family ATPase [Bacteroidaceae bacterium]